MTAITKPKTIKDFNVNRFLNFIRMQKDVYSSIVTTNPIFRRNIRHRTILNPTWISCLVGESKQVFDVLQEYQPAIGFGHPGTKFTS
jgi:hypothetical protein